MTARNLKVSREIFPGREARVGMIRSVGSFSVIVDSSQSDTPFRIAGSLQADSMYRGLGKSRDGVWTPEGLIGHASESRHEGKDCRLGRVWPGD